MDETYMKERNYRQVMFIRHQNERELRKLDQTLYSRHGIKAIHQWNLDQLNQEQSKLAKELVNVRNTTTTTWGYLPPRPGQEQRETASKVNPIEKILAAEKMMQISSNKRKPSTRVSPAKSMKDCTTSDDEPDDSKGTELLPIKTSGSSPGKLENISELDVKKARQNVFERLTSNRTSRRSRKSSLESVDEKHAFMPKKVTGKPPTGRAQSNSPSKPHNTLQSPGGQAPKQNRVVTISIVAEDTKTNNNAVIDASKGKTLQQDVENGKAANQKPEPIRTGRPLTPIKEGTSLTEKSGPGGKRISTRQYSFARSSTKGSIQVKGRKRKNTTKSEESEETIKLNPDGSLRTIHTLPDFEESLEEAMKARYLRMKFKPWFEREISVSEVWKDRDKPMKERIRLK